MPESAGLSRQSFNLCDMHMSDQLVQLSSISKDLNIDTRCLVVCKRSSIVAELIGEHVFMHDDATIDDEQRIIDT